MAGRLRVGVIGTGFGQLVQIPVFRAHPKVDLVAVASGRLEKARAVADRFDIPHTFVDATALVEADLDLVSIATPPEKINLMRSDGAKNPASLALAPGCVFSTAKESHVTTLISPGRGDGGGRKRMLVAGNPQGGCLSPLLSNAFLNTLITRCSLLPVALSSYDDDLVIVCRTWEEAEAALRQVHHDDQRTHDAPF